MKARVILVSGNRDWKDWDAVYQRLKYHEDHNGIAAPQCILYHGDCRGLDWTAAEIASEHLKWEVNRLPGFWHLGKRGGHVRNQALLDCALSFKHAGHPVYVECFPMKGGTGTQRMIELVRKSTLAPFLTVTGEE